ncbi:MAG: acyl-CoA dehydrogenase family protein [Bdellovibrionia bacterium]
MENLDFYQNFPELKNQFQEDPLLKRYLSSTLPDSIYNRIEPILKDLGELAVGEMLQWAQQAEAQLPRHIPYDPFGKRIDAIEMNEGWKKIEAVAAKFGIVAAAYEREFKEWSRTYQMSLLYLFHPSSAFVSCPLAMTDGAARAIELFGDEKLKQGAFKNLTSRDPNKFWTSGQWMTEKTGGSDVSGSQTRAKILAENIYELYGTKWFTSATTSQMAITLARVEGAEVGGKGLSLFYLETRDPEGQLNKIEIHRLKDKMGTKALPTAELSLKGTRAQLVGGPGQGIKKISALFNITRIYNAICSIAQMRRALALIWGYGELRFAFGKKLNELPLHHRTIEEIEFIWAGCFHLCMRTSLFLGKEECGSASSTETAVLRALTPVAKLYCGKQVVAVCSEVVEAFGGAGYIEDTGLPKLLRDAQTLAIWEGTTNVLSLDLLRAFEKDKADLALVEEFVELIKQIKSKESQQCLQEAVQKWQKQLCKAKELGSEILQREARVLAFKFAETYIAILTTLFAEKTQQAWDQKVATYWQQKVTI